MPQRISEQVRRPATERLSQLYHEAIKVRPTDKMKMLHLQEGADVGFWFFIIARPIQPIAALRLPFE